MLELELKHNKLTFQTGITCRLNGAKIPETSMEKQLLLSSSNGQNIQNILSEDLLGFIYDIMVSEVYPDKKIYKYFFALLRTKALNNRMYSIIQDTKRQ